MNLQSAKVPFLTLVLISCTILLSQTDTVFLNNLYHKLGSSFPFQFTSTAAVLFITFYFVNSQIPILNTLSGVFNQRGMHNFLKGKRYGRRIKHSKEHKFAMKNGGELGGISNEGNTCFINSVIQSLASSSHLISFMDSYIDSNEEDSVERFRSSRTHTKLPFTKALKTLIDNVNGKYGTRSKEFSTKQLLNKMPNGPKQNFFTGYNQEDAQEFYQLVMNILEKEYKKLRNPDIATPEPEVADSEKTDDYVDISNIHKIITGCQELGQLGTIYVPASQVDPNLLDADHKGKPLELITPVDGVSVERIGCLSCGEVGGIRYSVTSGLSLNLPNKQASYYSGFELEGLLNDWINPEIIEDVNCNRCGLEHTKQFIIEKIENSNSDKIIDQFKSRLQEIDQQLSLPCVTDEAFEKLTIKQMTKKSRKSKQIYLGRPPPLLAMHINRSVFDPRTYMIVKNSSKVSFPSKLNLTPFVAEPNDINMDARLPFRKQDERMKSLNINKEESDDDEKNVSVTSKNSISEDEGEENDEINSNPAKSNSTVATPDFQPESTPVDSRLLYNLKAVISHYGTHNYGHYICYRKLRGTWWRISDESVYIIDEEEVLNSPGTFMMFYEYANGVQEDLVPLDDTDFSNDEEEEEPEEEEVDQQKDKSAEDVTFGASLNDSGDDLYNTSEDDTARDEEIPKDSLGNDIVPSFRPAEPDEEDYALGEERAFHM